MSTWKRWFDAIDSSTPFHAEVWSHADAQTVRDSAAWDDLAANAIRRAPSEAFASRFKTYFVSDYVFVEDFIDLLARALASSRYFEHKKVLGAFLHLILQGEASIFRRSMKKLWGVDADAIKRDPTSAGALAIASTDVPRRMSAFLRRVADDGDHLARVAVIAVAEALYLHWGKRVTTNYVIAVSLGVGADGVADDRELYATWCYPLHASKEFEACVCAFVEAFNASWRDAGEESREACRGVVAEMLELEVELTALLLA